MDELINTLVTRRSTASFPSSWSWTNEQRAATSWDKLETLLNRPPNVVTSSRRFDGVETDQTSLEAGQREICSPSYDDVRLRQR